MKNILNVLKGNVITCALSAMQSMSGSLSAHAADTIVRAEKLEDQAAELLSKALSLRTESQAAKNLADKLDALVQA